MRVVALVPGGVSEQLLFIPTLDDLKRYYPDTEVDVVVEPQSMGAYRVSQSVRDVLRFDFKDRNSLADWGNLLGVIRDREYDVVISLGQSWLLGLLLWMTGIPTRIGHQGSGEIFLTNPVPLKSEQYIAAMNHDLLQGLGINVSACPELAINVPKPDIDWAEREQKRLAVQESGYVLIYGGAGVAQAKVIDKIYPFESWRQIIQDFQKRQPDLPVVVVQGAEDEQLVQEVLQSCPGVQTTAPTDIGKLAAMIAGANLLLCTDNATMQLAVAVQTYTIGLFGSTESLKLLPQSERFLTIKSSTTKIADIPPQVVMERVWSA